MPPLPHAATMVGLPAGIFTLPKIDESPALLKCPAAEAINPYRDGLVSVLSSVETGAVHLHASCPR